MMTYILNGYGLREKDMNYMNEIFSLESKVEKVILYGSRARGDFEKGSDVDLAIFGNEITPVQISQIRFKLENESPTLLYFDVLHFDHLNNSLLRELILKEGREIYTKR